MIRYNIKMYEYQGNFLIEFVRILRVFQTELDAAGLSVEEYARKKARFYCSSDKYVSLLFSIEQEIVGYSV